jgi:hypothetical protein
MTYLFVYFPYDEDFPVVCMDESPKQLPETVCEEKMETG